MDDARRRLVDEAYDAIRRRDLDAIRRLVDPEVEYVNPPDALEQPGERHRGSDRFVAVMGAFLEQFEHMEVEITELAEGSSGVMVVVVAHFRGRASSAPGSQTFAHVFRFNGPVVAAFEWYRTREEAAAAAGVV